MAMFLSIFGKAISTSCFWTGVSKILWDRFVGNNWLVGWLVGWLWNAVRDFISFFSFVRLCMKFNIFFAFIKLSFLKAILTSYNVSITRLLRIPHKTLSRPSIESACVLKVYLDQTAQKLCLEYFWRHSNRSRRVTVVI